jgi:hypothetical protein
LFIRQTASERATSKENVAPGVHPREGGVILDRGAPDQFLKKAINEMAEWEDPTQPH